MPSPCNAIRVVVVDDDMSFRSGLAANLADDGHAVSEFSDPRDVPPNIVRAADVVLTDYHMAAIDGLTFADSVHTLRPEAAIVLATAFWTVELETAVTARPFLHLCRKPVDYDELHTLVHQLSTTR
ncbi:MAG: response regulator [Candidatus Binatia bacterium]